MPQAKILGTGPVECVGKDAGTGPCNGRGPHSRFCNRHRHQYEDGIIDINGRKLRDFLHKRHGWFAECLAKNSESGVCSWRRSNGGRFCAKHWEQYRHGIIDYEGRKLRERLKKPGVFQECVAKNSGTGACNDRKGNQRFCHRHYCQFRKGVIDVNGRRIRKMWFEHVCGIPGCGKRAGKRGLCAHHYDEIVTHNRFDLYPSIVTPPPTAAMAETRETWSGLRMEEPKPQGTEAIVKGHPGSYTTRGKKITRTRHAECVAKNAGTGPCSRRVGQARFCNKHHAQYRDGIIDINGNKLRDRLPNNRVVFTECIAKDAGTGPCGSRQRGRFCIRHLHQYHVGIIDINGKKLSEFKRHCPRQYDECVGKNAGTGPCTKRVGKERFCGRHGYQLSIGVIDYEGRKLKDPVIQPFEECLGKDAGTGACSPGRGKARFCPKHYAQHLLGVIDINGRKLRDLQSPPLYKECVAKNAGTGECTRRGPHARFCIRHTGQLQRGIIDRDGRKIRDLKPVYTECIAKNAGTGCCSPMKGKSKFCGRHWGQYFKGIIDRNGVKIRDFVHLIPEKHKECLGKNAGTGVCSKRVGNERFCVRHRCQYERGVIDENGKKLIDGEIHGSQFLLLKEVERRAEFTKVLRVKLRASRAQRSDTGALAKVEA